MQETDFPRFEETLDPDDWEEFRSLGHRMIDDVVDYLQTVRERPVWQPIPHAVKDLLDKPLPRTAQGEAAAYEAFKKFILPHPMGNIHPRFWGWVIGTGTPFGMLAEMLAACMNPNLGGAEHVPNHVESQVVAWCKEMLSYPEDASGILVSGGSMANLIGLTAARSAMAGSDVRARGLSSISSKLILYGSVEMHSSILKAVELLGLGNEAIRKIPVDGEYRISIPILRARILEDRAAGHQPFCVVANAGTVNTGAFDDIRQLADICERENLWLHVDGAFGALAALSPRLRDRVEGMLRADSVAFDLHKWMYMPLEIGCVLVRSEADHRRAFSTTAEYLAHGGDRGLIAGSKWFSDYGVQLSRGFRALKAWLSLKAYGIDKYRRLIEQNVAQARYLARRVDAHPELERLAPVSLNIVCFRYVDDRLAEDALNALNQELLIRLHESGVAAPSYTTLNGHYVLRAAITNHRSRKEDFDMMVSEVARIGGQLRAEVECVPDLAGYRNTACWFGHPK
jgi:glutamate/tyrosine decarboxylase-like PLP-dependent enzyme